MTRTASPVRCITSRQLLTAAGKVLLAALVLLPGSLNAEKDISADMKRFRAYEALSENRYSDAVANFEEYFELSQKETSAYTKLQYCYALYETGQSAKADRLLEKELEKPVEDRETLLLAVELIKKRSDRPDQLNPAIDLLLLYNQKHPADGEVELQLAELYSSQDKKEQAIDYYTKSLYHIESLGFKAAVYRNIAQWRLAQLYFEKGDRKNARVYLLKYLSSNPDSLYGRYLLGAAIYFPEGNLQDAARELSVVANNIRAAKEQGVNTDRLHLILGQVHFLRWHPAAVYHFGQSDNVYAKLLKPVAEGRGKESAQDILHIARKTSDNLVIRVALIRILEQEEKIPELHSELMRVSSLALSQGYNETARLLTDKAAELKTKHPGLQISWFHLRRMQWVTSEKTSRVNRAALYAKLSIEQAEKYRLWESPEHKKSLLVSKAISYARARPPRDKEALQITDSVLEEDADFALAWYVRGVIHSEDNPELAISDLNKALNLEPDRIDWRYYRAIAFIRAGKKNEAVEDLKRIQESGEAEARHMNTLGYLYAEEGINLTVAGQLLEKAVALDPDNASYRDSLGWLYYRQKEFGPARYHLEMAALLMEEGDYGSPEIYYHLSELYLSTGNRTLARQMQKKATALAEKRQRDSASAYERSEMNKLLQKLNNRKFD